MSRISAVVVSSVMAMVIGSCHRHHDDVRAESTPVAKPVERGAAGDEDLRVMLSELASAKACELVRGQFRPLRDPKRVDVVTGLMWIRDCKITNAGAKVTFVLSGNGWQWADQQQKKAGGTFAIQQYVTFGMTATIPGALDVAYDRHDHVMSLWFTPSRLPEVVFTPIGGIDVDSKGAWSSVVGAIGSVFAHSPEHMAKNVATTQGDHELEKQLADGLSVTINLCTGLSRFGLGREPKGKMDLADAGETKQVPIELHPNSLMVFGPQLVGDAGFTANVESPTGIVHVDLACRDQAELLAAAYAARQPLPRIKTLASKEVFGKASLRIPHASCMVSVIARQLVPDARELTFEWQRPAEEIARSTGGPLIACAQGAK